MYHAICIPPLSLTKNKLIYIFHPNGQKERGEEDNTDQQHTIQDLHESTPLKVGPSSVSDRKPNVHVTRCNIKNRIWVIVYGICK
jgi:hypothetical protein